jgi:hypothetical protein
MKSARRQAFFARKQKSTKKEFSFIKLIIPIVVISLFFIFLKTGTKVWNGEDKVSLVYKKNSGDIGVTVLDPTLSEVTTLIIPGDTQVDISRNYGTFLIKNVWQMGINEKIGGILMSETVTQNFLFPNFLWSYKSPGFEEGNIKSILNFVFLPGDTNISFCDRVRMGLFVMNVKELGNSTINLAESKFLEKERLSDGELGYVIVGKISERLTVYFSDNEMSEKNIKINITDATGISGVSNKLGEILEVLGGKVVSVDKKNSAEESDCVVIGKNANVARKVAKLFSCKVENRETSFDLDINIGSKFAERF